MPELGLIHQQAGLVVIDFYILPWQRLSLTAHWSKSKSEYPAKIFIYLTVGLLLPLQHRLAVKIVKQILQQF